MNKPTRCPFCNSVLLREDVFEAAYLDCQLLHVSYYFIASVCKSIYTVKYSYHLYAETTYEVYTRDFTSGLIMKLPMDCVELDKIIEIENRIDKYKAFV
jgi:hypothetical protein